MKKPEKDVTKVVDTAPVVQDVKPVPDEKVVETTPKKTLVDIDSLTDEDLLKIIQDRKAKRAEIGAIHSVDVPIHVLMKKSAVVVPEVEANQSRMQQELTMLQTQFSAMNLRGK